MLDRLVLATPTYNSLEYLKIFLDSYDRYASKYPLVVVSDGSSDGTVELLKYRPDISFTALDRNHGQPKAYNTCFKVARDICNAKYILMLNDDMVFGPGWDGGLAEWKGLLGNYGLIGLNLVEPFVAGRSSIPYVEEVTTDTFDFDNWEVFYNGLDRAGTSLEVLPKQSFGPGFPFIIKADMTKIYSFDEVYAGGGCLDTDFLFTLWLDSRELYRLKNNILFHFSGGSTGKQKKGGLWVECGNIFEEKWGVTVGVAMHGIEEKRDIPHDTLNYLRRKNAERNNKGI